MRIVRLQRILERSPARAAGKTSSVTQTVDAHRKLATSSSPTGRPRVTGSMDALPNTMQASHEYDPSSQTRPRQPSATRGSELTKALMVSTDLALEA
ncbi:hypothetical protein B2J93_1687 [Marssonina coronariae]|uniref:Uncharacterized protein n=1 Tax=Diplocarpon coronariae TaxID=2795749 RepID=A0A218ZCB2_9HELO|nr:hypothetical protein B2J93_1687 [Marssonina coronariae]